MNAPRLTQYTDPAKLEAARGRFTPADPATLDLFPSERDTCIRYEQWLAREMPTVAKAEVERVRKETGETLTSTSPLFTRGSHHYRGKGSTRERRQRIARFLEIIRQHRRIAAQDVFRKMKISESCGHQYAKELLADGLIRMRKAHKTTNCAAGASYWVYEDID